MKTLQSLLVSKLTNFSLGSFNVSGDGYEAILKGFTINGKSVRTDGGEIASIKVDEIVVNLSQNFAMKLAKLALAANVGTPSSEIMGVFNAYTDLSGKMDIQELMLEELFHRNKFAGTRSIKHFSVDRIIGDYTSLLLKNLVLEGVSWTDPQCVEWKDGFLDCVHCGHTISNPKGWLRFKTDSIMGHVMCPECGGLQPVMYPRTKVEYTNGKDFSVEKSLLSALWHATIVAKGKVRHTPEDKGRVVATTNARSAGIEEYKILVVIEHAEKHTA